MSYFVDQHLRIIDASAGGRHSIFLTHDGQVYSSGELYEIVTYGDLPKLVPELSDMGITHVRAFGACSLASAEPDTHR